MKNKNIVINLISLAYWDRRKAECFNLMHCDTQINKHLYFESEIYKQTKKMKKKKLNERLAYAIFS